MVRTANRKSEYGTVHLNSNAEITGIYQVSIFTMLSKNLKKNASLLYMKLYSPKAWSYQARGQEEPIGNHKHAFIINSILHYLAFLAMKL